MRCYTNSEAEEWLQNRSRSLPSKEPEAFRFRVSMEDKRAFPFARWFAKYSTYEEDVLLWITEWGIWTSSENYHLFYKLRGLYGENHLLHEAPAHLFLAHEMDDFATMLQVAILNGWGGHILTHANYVNAFFSHDEYIDFFSKEEANLGAVKDWFAPSGT